jgi:2-hydroxychromene-2-carboxylate isomerase
MTIPHAIDSARLSVLLDIRHPLAYLALHPAIELANGLGIEINWLPLVAPPLNRPSEAAADDDRGIRHRRYRAQAIAREIECYAEAQGLLVREPYREVDPGALVLGWLWMRDRHPDRLEPFLIESFRAYWSLELDPSSESAVGLLVDSLGGEGAEFLAWCAVDGPLAAASLFDEVRERGLYGVPCYLVEDEVFLGRQHLPMIRWILEGRSGPVPI